LDFLESHPNVVSAETGKFVARPSAASFDKTLSQIEAASSTVRKLKSVRRAQDSEDSDWTVEDKPKAGQVTPQVVFMTPPVDQFIEEASVKRAQVVSDKPGIASTVAMPQRVADIQGCVLLGKKACRKQLETVCTPALAAHIVTFDKISREPGKFAKQLDFLRGKAQRFGVTKLDLDRAKKDTFSSVSNGRVADRDFEAEWRDTESSGSA